MRWPDLPALGYGAANVGNLYRELSDEQSLAVLEAAWNSGVRYFDTAPHYGLGLSERRLGAFLATKPRDEYTVSTKVGRLLVPVANPGGALDDANDFAVPADYERQWDFTSGGIRRSLDESLHRLGLDRVDVLMVAGRLTLAEQPALDRVVPQAIDNGIGVVAAGVFNSGLLATNKPGGRYEYGAVPDELLSRAKLIAAVCATHGVDLPTAALQYTLRLPTVASVVVGGSRPEQLSENARRMTETVPEQLWADLADAGLIP